jgi:hypothetical protein
MGSWTSTLLYSSVGLIAAQQLRKFYRRLRYGRTQQKELDFQQRYNEVKRRRAEIRKEFVDIIAAINPENRARFEKPELWITDRSAENQVEDFALAAARNQLLLELTHDGLVYLPKLDDEVAKKYLIKTTAYPVLNNPFSFSLREGETYPSYKFANVPPRFEWKITSLHQPYQLIFALKTWNDNRQSPIQFSELLQFRRHNPTDFLAMFVPTNENTIPWFVLHLIPCLLHDGLRSDRNFKMFFGLLSYLLSFCFSGLAVADQGSGLMVLSILFYGIQNFYLPYKYYPTSLHYFNFQGLALATFGYFKLIGKYAKMARLSSTQKTITNVILTALIAFSNNWPRLSDTYNNNGEVFWGALKANSISAGIIFMNFYLYFAGRMFVDNSNDNLRVVFNWNGITLGVAMGLMAFASFVTAYYPQIIS